MSHLIDKSNLKQKLVEFPEQFTKALEFSKNVKAKGKFENIIICGVGGSALPADIIKTYLDSINFDLPIIVCRDYNLPRQATKNSLVNISSYSGNTEETISCFEEAKSLGCQIIAQTKNGKIEELCQKYNLPYVKYPDEGPDFQPRYALGYAFASFVSILINTGLMPDIKNEIIKLSHFLKSKIEEYQKKGQTLAKEIKGYIPIIYSSGKYADSVARIIKIKFNETSKIQSFYNFFPELNHNEMVGFTNLLAKFYVLMIKNDQDHPKIQKRMEITAGLYREKGIKVKILSMEGKNTLERMFSSLYFGDWLCYFTAIEYGQDPTPVKMVEDLKQRLK